MVIKEGIMSSCFEVLWVGGVKRKAGLSGMGEGGERRFDGGRMEDVYAGHGSEKGGVLCTVEFGLMCVRKAEGGSGSSSSSFLQKQMKSNGEMNGGGKVNGNGVGNGYGHGHMNGYAGSPPYMNGVGKPPHTNGNGISNGMNGIAINGGAETVHRSLLLKPKILLDSVVEIL